MDCREFRELLGDEVDGRLAPADSARLAVHVASCAACADERRELASLRATFRAMPRPSVPAEFRAQVMERLPRGRVTPFPRALGWIAAVAAVAVVAVTLLNRGALGPEREVAKAVPAARHGAYDESGDGEATLDSRVQDAQPPAVQVAREADDDLEESRKKQTAAGDKAGFESKDRNAAKEEAPAAPAAAPKPTESAASPVADAGAEKEKRAPPAEPELKADAAAARAQSEDVRYVVFRDEAAALKFAASLRVSAEDAAKSKAAEPAAEATPVRREIADATREKTEDADRKNAGLLAQSSFTQRRVVARETVAASVSEKDLAAALAAAGGQTVTDEDEAKFRELLDETAEGASAPGGTSAGGGADAGGGATGATSSTGGPAGGRGKADATRAPDRRDGETPRVIVIVVLGPAPQPTPPEKR